jgi:CcmD family protein
MKLRSSSISLDGHSLLSTAALEHGADPAPEVSPRSTDFRAVEGGPEIASGETLLVEAYALIWLVLFGFIFMSWRRQSRIDQRVGELERALATRSGAK